MGRNLGVLMGLFSGLFGGHASADRYYSEAQFKENLVRQIAMAPQTLAQLYEYGVSEETKLTLEYFFYTDSEQKAAALHKALVELEYSGTYGQSASDASIYVITGWSVPIEMSKQSVVGWTESMCRTGFEHDAEFDGWGTNPNQ